PPESTVLNVTLRTDRAEYRPRQKGRIEIETTTLDGKPVSAQVALTAFDKSLPTSAPEYKLTLRQGLVERLRYEFFRPGSELSSSLNGMRSRVSWMWLPLYFDNEWDPWSTESGRRWGMPFYRG